ALGLGRRRARLARSSAIVSFGRHLGFVRAANLFIFFCHTTTSCTTLARSGVLGNAATADTRVTPPTEATPWIISERHVRRTKNPSTSDQSFVDLHSSG